MYNISDNHKADECDILDKKVGVIQLDACTDVTWDVDEDAGCVACSRASTLEAGSADQRGQTGMV